MNKSNFSALKKAYRALSLSFLAIALLVLTPSGNAQFDAPPKPDDAFKVQILLIEPGHIQIRWDILEHIYMYANKFTISASDDSVTFGSLQTPQGEVIEDPLFGEVIIYWDSVLIDVDYDSNKDVSTTITLGGQGCHKELGICYSPVSHDFSVDLPATNASGTNTADRPNNAPTLSDAPSQSIWKSMALAFLGGLALSFTPCVLPMVPILAGIVMGGPAATTPMASRITKGSVYILGTIISYAIIGAFAGYTGTQLQAWLQSTSMTIFLIGILVLMALSMFGVFKISIPDSITSKLNSATQGKSGTFGILLLGMTSALMVGACVTPILIGVVSGIITTGSPVYGALTMGALALGMGVPLLAVCFGAAKWLPKSGPWMTVVSHILGWGLLIVAAWLASNLLPINPLWPVCALMLCATIYCIWLSRQFNYPGLTVLVAVFALLTGVYGIGAYQGSTSIAHPIVAQTEAQPEYEAHLIADQSELDTILANSPNTKVLVDFRADWCTDCVRFERSTLRDPRVLESLQSDLVSFYQIDITKPDGPQAKVQKKYGVYGPPAMMIFYRSPTPRIEYGFIDANTFLSLIN